MSHLLKGKSKPHNPPPPSLFHQPSPSTSHTSLNLPVSGAPPPHGLSSTSAFASPTSLLTSPALGSSSTRNRTTGTSTTTPGLGLPLPLAIPHLPSRESTRATDRTDALWAEMQATLEAVELSAGGGAGGSGTTARVFGPDHERKLDELRAAQIALAQAWARSEADEAIETTAAGGGGHGGEGFSGGVSDGVGRSEGVVTDAGAGVGKSTVGTGSVARPGSSAAGMGGGGGQPQQQPQERLGPKKEEETEVDILLARKRREANDRYFQRVNQGVLDVVAKLEDVAIAMKAVEQESKELWGEQSESPAGSVKA
ncbi:hypothetical protein VTI74DRAFT_3250 [Chaetomium olivicolor]